MDDSSGRRGLGEDSKPMRRSWLRSKRRQTLGQPGPPGYPPRVLLFGGKLTLGRLQSGGFEYRKREAGRAVVARPTEWVLFRGPEALPRFWTERFSPGWSGESSPSIGFWCGARQASAHGLRSLWGWALGDVVDIGSPPGRTGGNAPPWSHRAEPRLARRLHASPHKCRRVRSPKFDDPPESYSRCRPVWSPHSSTKQPASVPCPKAGAHRRCWLGPRPSCCSTTR